MARAVSTVLDVAVCLLLIGVAVTTLAAAIPDEEQPATIDSDSTARSLATVTATVPAAEGQRAHGTLAGHLARATVMDGTLDGERIAPSGYSGNVRREIERNTDVRSHVSARWEPYPDAPLESRRSIGIPPPKTADVAATRITVDSGVSSFGSAPSFRSIAESIANAYVARLFPPERTRVRLVDPRTAKATTDRYEEAALTFGVEFDGAIADASSRRANERLATALADRLEADLRTRYETADEAASETTTGEVVIVVRRWEP